MKKSTLFLKRTMLPVSLSFWTLFLFMSSASFAQSGQTSVLVDKMSPLISSTVNYNVPDNHSDYYTTFDEVDCGQVTPSNDAENGLGNLHILQFANDFTVNPNEIFNLDSISFNILTEFGQTINAVDIYFYEDSGNGPGAEMSSMLAVTPTTNESIGEAFDFDLREVTFEFEDPISFTGSSSESVYWVGILLDYPGASSYMEVTTIVNTPNQIYYFDTDLEDWIAAEDDPIFDEIYDGVMSLSGECIELEGCTGQPDAGQISGEDPMEICKDIGFSLSVSGSTQASDLLYQWQEKLPEEEDWTDIEDANDGSLQVSNGITEDTDYRLRVECGNNEEFDFTDSITVIVKSASECFCTPTYSTGCTSGDQISNVTLVGESEIINNDSQCSPGAYGDYTDQTPADLAPGETYTLSVSTDYGSPTAEDVRAWIDYNGNGTFEDGEEIAHTQGNGLPSSGTGEFEFTVPENVEPGEYRMRVKLDYNGSDIQPCGSATWGETEDYTVEIIELEDCEEPVTAGEVVDTELDVCAGIAFSISVTGASEPANNLTRQWQFSPAGEDDWTDVEGAHANTYTVSNGIDEPTDFRYKVVCNDGEPDYSDIIEVNLNPAHECYCIPQATNSNYYINNFSTTNAIDNISNLSSGFSTEGYGDFTDMIISQEKTGEISFDVDVVGGSSGFRIWVDWDQDGQFSADEVMYQSDTYENSHSGSFTVPEEVDLGKRRMRIANHVFSNTGDVDPCQTGFLNGEFEDYTFEVIELEDCEGIPSAGTPEEDTLYVCAGVAFTVSVSDASGAANNLYRRWQSSPAGEDDWTDISGSGASTYVAQDGVYEPTDFRYVMTCNEEETAVSSIIEVNLNPGNECYCTPTYSYGCSSGDQISNVSLTGESNVINNDSGCSDNAYGDYTDLTPADLAPGETYTLSVSTDNFNPNNENVRAWIDYNHNGNFEDSEEVANTQGNGLPSEGTGEFEFTVPENVDPGNYRMRVRLVYGSGAIQPCDNESSGETEDYTVEFFELENCEGPVSAGIAEDDFEVCASNPFTISVSGASDPANGLVRQWQSSPVGEDDWADMEGAHSNTYNVGSGIDEETDFRYVVTCNEEDTDISEIISVSLKSANECYCIPENNSSTAYYISNVSTVDALQNIDNNTEFADNGYGDYSDSHVIIAYPGQEFSYSISAGNGLSMSYGIWLDIDQNGNFDEPLEKISNSDGYVVAPFTGSFEVPADFEEGTYRLRVRTSWAELNIGPCEDTDFGETEDYTLQVIVPGCLPPLNIEINYITDVSAQINWDANDGDSWVVIYGETGFDPETEGESISIEDNPSVVLSDLNEHTTYDVYVKTLCDEDESVLIGPIQFTTSFTPPANTRLCDAITLEANDGCVGGPYTNVAAFEELNEPIGSCHNQFRGTNTVWFTFTASADGEAVITTDFDSTEIQTEIVVFEAPAECEDVTSLGEEVGCAGAAANGTLELEDLTPGETYYVKVGGFNSEEGLFCIEVQMDGAPVCLAPSEINIGDITYDTVEVSWTANGTATQWEVIYGVTGFNPETEGESVLVNTAETTLTGLTPETDYDVYVRAICSENISSDLTGPEVFTTEDMSVDNQIFTDFTFYPNPVKDQLTLKAGSTIEKVEVYNLLGQVILELQPNTLETNLNTENLQSGVYLMNVTIDGNQKTFRIVKK